MEKDFNKIDTMKKVKVKKMFNGLVDVRDHIVANCVKTQTDLQVKYLDEVMTLGWNELHKGKKYPNNFKSKWGGTYKLIGFEWKPNQEKQNQLF